MVTKLEATEGWLEGERKEIDSRSHSPCDIILCHICESSFKAAGHEKNGANYVCISKVVPKLIPPDKNCINKQHQPYQIIPDYKFRPELI